MTRRKIQAQSASVGLYLPQHQRRVASGVTPGVTGENAPGPEMANLPATNSTHSTYIPVHLRTGASGVTPGVTGENAPGPEMANLPATNSTHRTYIPVHLRSRATKEEREIEVPYPSLPGDDSMMHNNTNTTDEVGPVHSSKQEDDSKIIHASLLIPGEGGPLRSASVVVQSGKIQFVGPSSKLPSQFKNLPTTYVRYLLPGLWDCHVHLLGVTTFNFASILTTSDVAKGVRIARNLHDLLMAGFTSVRDLGGYGPEVAKVVEDPTSGIVGPNIYSAGSALSQTAGHGDVFDMPVGFTQGKFGIQSGEINGGNIGAGGFCIVDGVEECRRAVRLQVRRGAKLIKVFASGGVLSIADDPLRQQFSDEELSTIVEEAKRMGRLVAAHVHGKQGIMAALKAGVGTIEHGTYLDEECLDIMKKQGTVYIATRTIVEEGVKHPELMSPESYEKMKVTAKNHEVAYKLAIKSGVKIALGTDSGISTPGMGISLGMGGSELAYAVAAGMTELEAVRSATANGPLALGSYGMAPKSGQIEVGYDADFIGMEKNPLDNVGLLKDPKNVTHVWKGGKLFKSPERDSSPFSVT